MAVREISSLDDLGEDDLEGHFVIVEESPIYPGQLVFTADDQRRFRTLFDDYVSRYQILKELSLWDAFMSETRVQDYNVYIMTSATEVLERDSVHRMPLEIEGFKLPLFGYQQYGLAKALDLVDQGFGYMFFNWGTGSGKSIAAAAGAQELIANRCDFDIALVFTLRKIKGGLARAFTANTTLRTRIIDGTKAYRVREYAKQDADVYVLNYEKAHHDQTDLQRLIKGKRVLFVFDEVQRILVWSGGKATLAAKGINALVRKPKKSAVWPMSASIINQDPARYWRVFQWAPSHPLGNLTEFRKEYQISGTAIWTGMEGVRAYQVKDVWNEKKLEEVRHRVASETHAVRKTDPGVRELFKGIQFVPIEVELSETDRAIYDTLREQAMALRDDGDYDSAGQIVHLMKLVCNTSEALFHTGSQIALPLMEAIEAANLKTALSAKFEMVLDKILEIQGQGDKVVLFTHYTKLGLFLIAEELKKHRVGHVLHWGGTSDKTSLEAQDRFNRDPSVTVFASSDAGTYGLNLQSARYVINYEIPMSYDDLMQRNSRIDRADSHLDGLTCYGYYCRDTIEERSFSIMEQRRELAQIVQGTREDLSRDRIAAVSLGSINQRAEIDYLLGRD